MDPWQSLRPEESLQSGTTFLTCSTVLSPDQQELVQQPKFTHRQHVSQLHCKLFNQWKPKPRALHEDAGPTGVVCSVLEPGFVMDLCSDTWPRVGADKSNEQWCSESKETRMVGTDVWCWLLVKASQAHRWGLGDEWQMTSDIVKGTMMGKEGLQKVLDVNDSILGHSNM